MTNDIVEIIAWNTYCMYTQNGQRIAAGRTVKDDVFFVDVDRFIGGKIRGKFQVDLEDLTPEWVMARYLRNMYEDMCISEPVWKTLAYCAREAK